MFSRTRLDHRVRASYRPRITQPPSRLLFERRATVMRLPTRIRKAPSVNPVTAAVLLLEEEATVEVQGTTLRHTADHLVVMVNGLNGAPGNWNVLKEALKRQMGEQQHRTLFYVSHSNRRLGTFSGICACADRLSKELRYLIERFPNLSEISFLVHSMGGLISRYACGLNYDPESKTVFGLRPRHYISIASPHLGCDVTGESQVPLLGWIQSLPIFGSLILRPLISVLTPFVMKYIYRRTGQQLFLMDGKLEGDDPLIGRLVQDVQGEGHFISALRAFKSRTCYANVRHDGMVGWANASMRRLSELPHFIDTPLCNSISYRSDPLTNALWTTVDTLDQLREFHGDAKREWVEFMLRQLQRMPWCRIDVRFQNWFIPLLAHTHIQVTRKWIDRAGMPIAKHIAQTFAQLDRLVTESQ